MDCISQSQASTILRNKFVIIIGDSIQRLVYKDLVLLLEKGAYLTMAQLKLKGEMRFESDCLLEGGLLQETDSEDYQEVRQYCRNHNLIRFYYAKEIFSDYMESILVGIKNGVKPDIIVLNSCVWDLSRFNQSWVAKYDENLHKMMENLKRMLPPECVLLWHMSMPVNGNIVDGYFQPQWACQEAIDANFYSGTVAKSHGMITVDMNLHVRQAVQSIEDGPPTVAVAFRRITCLLLEHVASVWELQQYLPHRWFHLGEHVQQASQAPEPIVNTLPPANYRLRMMPQHVPQHLHPVPLNFSQPPVINPYLSGVLPLPWHLSSPLHPQPLYEVPRPYSRIKIPYYMHTQSCMHQACSNFRTACWERPTIAGAIMDAPRTFQGGPHGMETQNHKGSKKSSTRKQVPPPE